MDLDAALQAGRLADIAAVLDSQELQVRVWWEEEGRGRGREARHDPPDPTHPFGRGSCSPVPAWVFASLNAGTVALCPRWVVVWPSL